MRLKHGLYAEAIAKRREIAALLRGTKLGHYPQGGRKGHLSLNLVKS